ncbi:TonB-dependent hemoglobin/transferrin/lactoferrin family receptor [Lonepinella sp. BR2357]|uniref:TonB-dependent hemoglobin/transferrin/lactoferrin family receptor n=1 Tax=Lonepinella sp. BR2357 TaxID=3434549 RepID=UPI003F6DFF35
MSSTYRLTLGAFCIALALNPALSQAEEQLDQINVVGKEDVKIHGEIKKTRRQIQDELVSDSRDLVRYTTDVGISDNGRHTKGFAIRGVEGNRVGIIIDGVALPDSEENSLYARYGNFNSSRIVIDPELVQGIDIVRGSDSFNAGSGNLGGSVNYHTLTADDIILPADENGQRNKVGVLLKSGFGSKNNEWTNTGGLAYKDNGWEAVALYSQRRGQEMKSRGNGEDIYGDARGIPDPSNHRNHNFLGKLSYLLNDTHKFSVSYTGARNWAQNDEKSYALLDSFFRNSTDKTHRDNLNVAYEYFPVSDYLAYVKLDYDWQRTNVEALNYKTYRNISLIEWYDRRMRSRFNRISLRADSVSLGERFGTHLLSLRMGLSDKRFYNQNIDTIEFPSQNQTYVLPYTIQNPVKTINFYASLQDKVQWNDTWSSKFGIRYDYTKLNPQDVNEVCHACEKTTPKGAEFQGLSASGSLDYQINDIWRIGYSLSSGYRVPSASEMYFTFKSLSGNWLANPKLKAELSFNNAIQISANGDFGSATLNAYHTSYKDFLYERETVAWVSCGELCSPTETNGYAETLFQQAQNLDRARIMGFDFTGKLNLNGIWNKVPQGWNAMGSVGYSKSKLYDTDLSLLSIQPIKVILGFGYDDPDDRWGFSARWTYLGAKKGKDAQILNAYNDPRGKTKDYPWLNGSAALFDVFGFVRVNKNITLRAGAYNIFNRKYHTWDALRGINITASTTNTVDKEGKGLERYYAPGRNFAASVEMRF